MNHMSPFVQIMMKALRIASLLVAALMLGVVLLVIWQKTQFQDFGNFSRQDIVFMVVVSLLGLLSYWIARAIGRELGPPGA